MSVAESELIDIFVSRLEKKKSAGTARHRKSHMEEFCGWLSANDGGNLLELKKYDIQDHFDAIRGNHPDHYATTRLSAINSFYTWLQDEKERLQDRHGIDIGRDDNPAKGILAGYEDIDFSTKKSRIYDTDIIALKRDEASELVDCENVPEPKTRNQLLLKLLLQTGIRAKEAQRIKLSDITTPEEATEQSERRRIMIDSAKGGERRPVFYQPSLDETLSRWVDQLRKVYAPAKESPYLFVSNRSEQLSYTAIRDTVYQAAENAGIQEKMYVDASGNPRWKVSPHTLRHTMARFAVTGDERIDIARLARLMGHFDKSGNPNIETTKKYLSFCEQDLKDASTACIPDI